MDTPVYTVSVTVGGSSQTTESKIGNVLPQTIITRQSGSIVATFLDAAGAAFDLSSLTSLDMFAKPFNSSETPVNMGTGVISGAGNNIYTVVWVKDKIPAGWSTFAQDRDGAIVLYLQLEETGTLDFYQWGTRFNVDDGDYTGTADVLPLVSLVFYYNPIWGYNNTTVDADPGAGIFRMDSTALASVTELYISDDNQSSVDMQTLIQSSAVGTNIYITNPNVATDAALFTVSGAATNNTGYTTVPVTFVDSGSSSFTNSAILSFSFIPVSNEAPFIDSTALVKNAADATKLIGFDASAITTATERTITMPDANVDLTPGTGSFEEKLSGATLTAATVATGDKITGQDVNDSDNLKTFTAQSIADLKVTEVSEDTTPQLAGFLDAADNRISSLLGIGAKTTTVLDIATGAVTQTQIIHNIGTESAAAADDLDSIVPATGQTEILITMNDAAEVPTIKHATGTNTFLLAADTDLLMVMNTFYHFHHDGTNWKLIGSSASGGGVVQQVGYNTTSTSASTSTAIPFDNTIPQSTEGASCGMDLAYTPLDTANILYITVSGWGTSSAVSGWMMTLFKDSDTDALMTGLATNSAAFEGTATFTYKMVAGTVSAITFKTRFGANSGTAYWIRKTSGDLFSTAKGGSILITEVTP